MNEIICPYCGQEQDVNHEDGYGYQEGETYDQDCVSCDRYFKYTTMITYSYNVYCLNEEDHELAQSRYEPSLWECKNCSHHEVKNDN